MRTKAVLGWFVAILVIALIVIDYYIRHEVRRQVKVRIEEFASNISRFDQIFASKAGDDD